MTPAGKCKECGATLNPDEAGKTRCMACAEADFLGQLGAGLLGLPDSWYEKPPRKDRS